jgi:DNA polymerase-4
MGGEFSELRVAHIDMEGFFASVEEMVRPPLREHPLVVGGAEGSRHGVVTTANYRAREYDISSGMALALARRRCPQLVNIPVDHEKYIYFSLEVLRVLEKFTPAIEPTSVDEAFLGLRGLERAWPDPRNFAIRLQEEIREKVGVTASIGIGPTKMIAKIASGLNKPEGITVLTLEGYRRLIGELPLRSLWGIGPQTEKALTRLGFRKIRDLAQADPTRMKERFGVLGLWLHASARGELDDPVVPYYQAHAAKSFGHEWTLPENLHDVREMKRVIRELAARVARRVRKKNCSGRTVTLKVRFPDFETPLRSLTLPAPIDDGKEIARAATILFDRIPFRGRPVRLLGVSLSGIESGRPGRQESFLEDRQKRIRLLGIVDRIQDRWGEDVISGE